MHVLNDGTVIPSHFGIEDTATFPEPNETFGNFAPRIGEVKEIIWPSSEKSVSKKFTEYRVLVQHRDLFGRPSTTEYPNCFLMSSFGGKADKLKYTFRKKVDGEDSADGLGEGSKVVILCINGETNQALIIGGVRDGTDDADVEDSGHHLLWEFNGVRAEVNNDGEFILKFGGATAADGSTESENGGTSITMKQNGDLVFEHDNESITLDHAGKSWDVQADEKVKITGTTGVETHTDEYTKINSGRGTKIGGDGATDALVKGTTWRSAEMQRHQTMLAGLGQAIGGLASLGATIMAAGSSLTTVAAAHGVPVVGPIVGAIPLGVVAASLMACMGIISTISAGLSQVVTAISTYEGGAATYLSNKNTTD
jgi:hypothetical protein